MANAASLQLELIKDLNVRQNFQILQDRLAAVEQFLGANGPQIATSGCPLYVAPQNSFGQVPGLIKSISTKMGRPVQLALQFANVPIQLCELANASNAGSNGAMVIVQFTRDGVLLPEIPFQVKAPGATAIQVMVPPGVFTYQDPVPQGIHLYRVQAMVPDSHSAFTMQGVQLVAYET